LLRPISPKGKHDEEALHAGQLIANGFCSRENLEVIYRRKTKGRGIARLGRNADAEITDALQIAVNAKTERSAIAVLCGLDGVDVPVASAVMTAVNPARYTVIDFRALEALGVKTADRSIDFYLAYCAKCRELADEYRASIRDLDRALWQWSMEHAPAPLPVSS
jgi:hypothetical protein